MPNLKQGTLSFASAKRTNSTLTGKSRKRTSATEKGKNKRVETPVDVPQSDEKFREFLEISSSDEGAAAAEITVPAKRTRASTKTANQASPQLSQSEKQRAGVERERLDVEDKAGRYRKYYNDVRSKMGYISPSKY
jgi:DNA polymerase delta subunit 4